MADTNEREGGRLGALVRLLSVALHSPGTQQRITRFLQFLDPGQARELVRVLLHTDPGLKQALLNALPQAANVVLQAWEAVLQEIVSHPSQQGLRRSLDQLKGTLQVQPLGKALGRVLARLARMQQANPSTISLAQEFADGLKEGMQQEGLRPGEVLLQLMPMTRNSAGAIQRLFDDPETAEDIEQVAGELQRILVEHSLLRDKLLLPVLNRLLRGAMGGAG